MKSPQQSKRALTLTVSLQLSSRIGKGASTLLSATKRMPPCALIALALAGLIQSSSGFSPLLLPTGRIPSPRQATHLEAEQGWRAPPRALGCQSRRECLGLLLGPAPFLAAAPKPAAALVKGSAPPPKGGSSSGATGSGRPKCKVRHHRHALPSLHTCFSRVYFALLSYHEDIYVADLLPTLFFLILSFFLFSCRA